MENKSAEIDRVARYYRSGMEDGPDDVIKAMPVLLGRIQELERALIPFARAGVKNNKGLPLTQVYHKDCIEAYKILSPALSEPIAKQEEELYLPAE